jgi:hypothetical protein
MAGTIVADQLEAASTSTLVIKNGVANTPPTIQDSAGTQIGTFCRAWVNFNGTGTVAIRASFNVTSITDNGTGNYTVNFTNALPDANYSVSTGGCTTDNTAQERTFLVVTETFTTSSFRIFGTDPTSGSATDYAIISANIFR